MPQNCHCIQDTNRALHKLLKPHFHTVPYGLQIVDVCGLLMCVDCCGWLCILSLTYRSNWNKLETSRKRLLCWKFLSGNLPEPRDNLTSVDGSLVVDCAHVTRLRPMTYLPIVTHMDLFASYVVSHFNTRNSYRWQTWWVNCFRSFCQQTKKTTLTVTIPKARLMD